MSDAAAGGEAAAISEAAAIGEASAGRQAELTEALGRDPGPHTVIPLLHNAGNAVTAGIWRYAGDGWSVVRKEVEPAGRTTTETWAASERPDHWNFWGREPLAYRSGLARDAYAGSGIIPPHLLAAYDRPGGGVGLWLADAAGTPGEEWDVAKVGRFARALGRGQGGYPAGRRLPDQPWLSRRWLRQYVASKGVDGSVPLDGYGDLAAGLTRLWAERDALLSAVEALPQTLCHLDVWPRNLVADGDCFVLLDWAFVGIGAIGEDAGNLVPDCVWDGFLPTAALPELAEAVWDGYLAGLREVGWAGDERLARLGFTAGGAVKYAWLAEWSVRRLRAGELGSYGGYSTVVPGKLLNIYAAVFGLLLDWADEARSLRL